LKHHDQKTKVYELVFQYTLYLLRDIYVTPFRTQGSQGQRTKFKVVYNFKNIPYQIQFGNLKPKIFSISKSFDTLLEPTQLFVQSEMS